MSRRSRLTKKFEKRSKETLILSLIGIALLLFIILRYGIPVISDISFKAGQVTSSLIGKDDEVAQTEDESFVPVPSLDFLPKATNEQNITVTGASLEGIEVELFVNGNKEDSVKADSTGEFKFDVVLSDGANLIKVRAIKNGKESEFSDTAEVLFKKSPPELSIDSPRDGDSLNSSPTNVNGKTDSDVSVTVNGFLAILSGEGNYSYSLSLTPGDNEIKVVATDAAGNTTEKSIKINYSP